MCITFTVVQHPTSTKGHTKETMTKGRWFDVCLKLPKTSPVANIMSLVYKISEMALIGIYIT